MPERIYVHVNTDFDSTGFVIPKAITWADGRTFVIDSIMDFRPTSSCETMHPGERYTVMIGGHERYLFFEHNADYGNERIGRWFVEKRLAPST